MAKYSLNENQVNAISSDSKQILVSASAGTGKTFVMVERVINLILNKKIPIDRFLLVTFAKASAEEMRERIFKALYDNIEKDEFVKEQLKKLPLASISTLHSFCSDIIRTYFYALDIPPKFLILEPAKTTLLKSKALEELFDTKYEKKDQNFLNLVDIFGNNRRDDGLMSTVLDLYKFSCGLDDPNDFLARSSVSLYNNPDIFKALVSTRIDRKLTHFKFQTLDILDSIYSDALNLDRTLCQNLVLQIDNILRKKSLKDKLSSISCMSFPSLRQPKGENTQDVLNIHDRVKLLKSDLTKYIKDISFLIQIIEDESSIQKIRDDVRSLCNLTLEFSIAYALEKKKIDSLDFSDLEHFALKLLQNDEVLADIQDKYEYVFVDEYQDTSKVQEALISAISTHNLFMVGDIKQSIYSFRQCDKNIFLKKVQRFNDFSDGQLIFLNQNFRSSGKILSFVNQVFKNIMTTEVGDDYLKNSMFDINDSLGDVEMDLLVISKENEPAVPKIYSVKEDEQKDEDFTNSEKEGKFIANKIQSLVGSTFFDGKILREITYSDFAILLRGISSNHAECVYKTIKDSGIPVTISSSADGILDYPEVGQAMNFISVLLNFQKDIPLLSVLHSPFFNFDDNELLDIRKSGVGKFFFECLESIPENHQLFHKIKAFFDTIEFYRTVALARGGAFALTRAVVETPFSVSTRALPYGSDKIKRVDKFIQLVSSLDETKNLVDLNMSIEKLKRELNLDYSNATSDAVKMMSIHKSKGLEFPICFVGGINIQFNLKSANSTMLCHSEFGVALRHYDSKNRRRKNSLPFYAISQVVKDENIEEELRVLYVALTRAKNKLFLTGIVKEADECISNIDDLNITKIDSYEGLYSARSYLDFILGSISQEPERKIAINFISDMSEKPIQKKLSVDLTHICDSAKATLESNLTYTYPRAIDLTLPTKFSASSLKRAPYLEEEVSYSVKSRFSEDSSQIGIAYHKILELSKPFSTLEQVALTAQNCLDQKLITQAIFAKIDLHACVATLSHDFMSYGVPITEKMFIGLFEAQKFTQHPTKTKTLIQGVIDLLLFDEKTNSCILVDYKFSGVDNDDVLRKRYAEQIEIYRYAVEHILQINVTKSYIINVRNGHAIEIVP